MQYRVNTILLCAALVVASSCQWRGMKHRKLIQGISTNQRAYEEQFATDEEGKEEDGSLLDAIFELQEKQQADNEKAMDPSLQSSVLLPAKLKNRPEIRLVRTGYVTSYNTNTRICNWVAWRLTANHVSGEYKRKGMKFTEDVDVPMPRALHSDYIRSGYDRGHMCPAGDNKWSANAMIDCFLLTNICPQNHNLNIGDWHELENRCRSWAERYGCIYIVCGPILYKQKHGEIGKNKITVPKAFFKVVLCMSGKPKAIGFIYRNEPGNRPQGDYVNTVDQVERITGIDFFADLPDNIEEKVEREANLNDWR